MLIVLPRPRDVDWVVRRIARRVPSRLAEEAEPAYALDRLRGRQLRLLAALPAEPAK